MNLSEFEKRLELHGKVVKYTMAAPFDTETEVYYMKNKKRSSKKLVSLIAAAAVLACLGTAFAAGGLGGWYSSTTIEFESVLESAPITEELGFAPVLIDEFENGYSFVSGKGADNTVTEDDGSVKEEFKSAFFTYEKDGDEVWFSQDRSTGINVEKGELVSTVNGIDVYYYSYKNKIVPDDYEMSVEDIAAEERGELIFSWGSDKVQLSVVQSVEWRMGDIACCLMQLDGALSAEELVAMAEEAINAK